MVEVLFYERHVTSRAPWILHSPRLILHDLRSSFATSVGLLRWNRSPKFHFIYEIKRDESCWVNTEARVTAGDSLGRCHTHSHCSWHWLFHRLSHVWTSSSSIWLPCLLIACTDSILYWLWKFLVLIKLTSFCTNFPFHRPIPTPKPFATCNTANKDAKWRPKQIYQFCPVDMKHTVHLITDASAGTHHRPIMSFTSRIAETLYLFQCI